LLELTNTTETQMSSADTVIHLKIDKGGIIKINLYDKHDVFTFLISKLFFRHVSAADAKDAHTRLRCS
jgi:hypothetical protein